ncbi:MAG: hypothetical protein HXS46_18105 [Theionarchaea archaeon]|nr:hypothetical protein [Theionarchaea archaeon]
MEFYSEPIIVKFAVQPLLEKKPGLPAEFIWRGKSYTIIRLLKEWHDYRKRGKIREFYTEKRGNAPRIRSGKRGSWGVGRDYYRVLTGSEEIFDIYYDRRPTRKQKGEWVLLRKVRTID